MWPLYAAGFTTAFGAHAVAANLGGFSEDAVKSLLTLGFLLALYDGAEVLLKPVFGTVADRIGARPVLLAGLVGFVLSWLSQSAVLVMGGIGVALAVQWLISRERPIRRALLITMPLWALASVVAIATGLRSMTPSTRQFMDDFWRQGFLPLPLKLLSDLQWFADQAMSVFTDPTLLRYRWPAAFLVVAALGVVASWRSRRHVAMLLLGPIVVALAAAVAHQYPFGGRLMFYQIPGLLLAIAASAESMRRLASRLHPALGGGLTIALLVPPVGALVEAPPPYDIEHHQTVLR